MFRFLCKNALQTKDLFNGESKISIFVAITFRRSISISTSSTTTSNSFTVSYLIDSCGLSQQNAISLSKRIQFKDSSKPDSVLTLLRNYGFVNTHISKFVLRRPELLLFDPIKTLQPKFDYFSSIGISGPNLVQLLSSNPALLTFSLDNTIIPVVQFLKKICHSADVIPILKCQESLAGLQAKLTVLRSNGVPDSNIVVFLKTQPRGMCGTMDKFSKTVEKVKEMGFDPLKGTFVTGIRALLSVSESLWQEKVGAYRRWGWSDEEIRKAFLMQPCCMLTSYDKINGVMDFLVNKMGYDASLISQCPNVILYSLEKRIIPRGSILQVLILNGLVKNNCRLSTVFCQPEKCFLKNFVTKFEKQVPQLMDLYQGILNGLQTS